jgi:hypothetical protein
MAANERRNRADELNDRQARILDRCPILMELDDETRRPIMEYAMELEGQLAAKDDFSPTPEQVNALPPRLREYIHGLEARCDPSGDVRENIIARDTCRALELELAAKDAELERLTKLAYIGDHFFPDLTWKARCDELVADLAVLKRSLPELPACPDCAAKDAEMEKMREALSDAAASLETIERDAGQSELLMDPIEIRGYAHSRAVVARRAALKGGE